MVLLDQPLAVDKSYYDLAGLGVLAAVDHHEVTVVDAELLYRGAVDLEEGGAFRACNQELVDVEFAVFEVLCWGREASGHFGKANG